MYVEKDLIEKLKHDNHSAFQNIYFNYKERLYAFIFSLVRSHDETEELLQEVFIKIWNNRKKLDSNFSLNAYIYKIAKNTTLNFLRQKTYRLLLEKELISSADNVDNSLEGLLINKDLVKYINTLTDQIPSRCREVFLLRYEHNLSYKEIAIKLSISENTVDTQLRKALKFLREKLEKENIRILFILTAFGATQTF